MKPQQKCYVIILAVTVIAAAMRLPQLTLRPMHCDEAVHAVKFGALLNEHFYRYDKNEYHGPTLNYFTLIPAWISNCKNITDVNEAALRIVPVFFGMMLVLLFLLITDGLGRNAVIFAAIFTALSPAFVYYSRYYIQETLLVCFTFGVIVCGWRYTQNRKVLWALCAGIFLGLMFATKETSLIAFISLGLAIILTVVTNRGLITQLKIKPGHLILAIAAAAIVSSAFYSSFFTNPRGIIDSLLTYETYFGRAAQNQNHFHPWYYYLKILICNKSASGQVWTEALIVVLALFGFLTAIVNTCCGSSFLSFPRKLESSSLQWIPAFAGMTSGVNSNLLRFLAFYTVIMTVTYSAIPYKTPWCLLGFLQGMILLAGIGAATILTFFKSRFVQTVAFLLLLAGVFNLARQSYLGSFKYYADPDNPYVYAHTTNDIFTITRRVEQIASAYPAGRKIYIEVICPEADYWPLPWYLRSFPNIGWWNKVDDKVPAAPLIIASPKVYDALMKKLYELPPPGERNLYVPLFDRPVYLRPNVELIGLVTKDLSDSFLQEKK